MNNDEVRRYADQVFEHNMARHGFSHSQTGLYRAAFKADGTLYENWQVRVRSKQPDPREYPDLYEKH